jgi:hypothetical protein
MKHLFGVNSLIISLFILIVFTQCSPTEKKTKVDPAFTNYIQAFTGDVVSTRSAIRIQLTQKHSSAKPGEVIHEKLFEFTPNIDGEAQWINEKTIAFKPDQLLPAGKQYQVKFKLGNLLRLDKELSVFEFGFQVMKQNFELEFTTLEAYDPNDLKNQKLKGAMYSYDYADATLLEESVEAFQNGKELHLSWSHSDNGKIHDFTIDSLVRSEQKGEVQVQWNMKNLGVDQKETSSFAIPSLNEFKVLDVKTHQGEKIYVEVSFSDPLNESQDLNGMAWFVPQLSARIVVDGNTMKIFPNEKAIGDFSLRIADGLKNNANFSLGDEFKKEIRFESLKPAIELIGDGNILPSSNGLIFPFKAVSLSAVNVKIIKVYENNIQQFFQLNQINGDNELKRVGRLVYKGELTLNSEEAIDYGQWNNFAIDLSSYIEVDPGSIYRIVLSFDQNQSLYTCEENDEYKLQKDAVLKDDIYWDNSSDYWYYYDFGNNEYVNENYDYYEREDPCKPSYYMTNDRVKGKNILASDLGIIAKGNNSGELLVAVTDLVSTDPLSGIEVEIYNFQQQLIETKMTDEQGFATIELTKKPFFLIAKKQKQRGYLRLDQSSALNLSMFDIGGQNNEKGLKGYLYGERGVWRPGDSLYLSFMLEDRNRSLPKDHPVVCELYTPRQQLFARIVKTNSVGGIYDFRTATPQDAPTGDWRAVIKVGGAEFTKNLKIETVKPNRLKMNLDFGKEILSSTGNNKATLEVKWLHGAVAGDLKADIEMSMSVASNVFKKYSDYSFQDQSRSFYSYPKMVFDGQLDADGKAEVNPEINEGSELPGMLMANFKTRAFEKGGEFSVDRMSIPYSPYESYVGVKIPEGKGWNGALYSDEEQIIPIVTLDENGKPIDRENLKVEIYNIYWRWWWERSSSDDLSRYVSNKHEYLLKTATISTKNGKANFKMNLGGRYYGRKYIRVIDPVSGHATGQEFYVTYSGWDESGENPGGAEMLTFTTDQKKYQVGDKIKVQVPGAPQGRLLVSLETGSQILDKYWVDLADIDGAIEIEATEEMSPNFFIHLSLIQAHNQKANDLPIRMFGVQPVFVENKNSHVTPQIQMPDVLEPETGFKVQVSEKEGKAMSYTLAVVDEGLLDLTRFKTPSPWNYFNRKEALSIRTWDMYQYVMGAFTGKMAGLLAIGGDEAALEDGGAKANRFKPVVRFIGPFSLNAGEAKVHELQMPNYVGAVRTMVVAKNESAYGSAEQSSKVKKPLMVLATLPRVLGPSEEVDLPVTVFAMDDKIKSVKVEVETNDLFQIKDEPTKNISFDRQGDQVINFKLKAKDQLGIAKAKIKVSGAGETATYEIELDVRAPNPKITDVKSFVLNADEELNEIIKNIGIDGTNSQVVELSVIPPLNLEKRLNYLVRYPHGCIEQTTSGAFAQLHLNEFVELSKKQEQDIEEHIKYAINSVKKFQVYSGGFAYWPGMEEPNDWGTTYAGHFILEAKAMGYDLPPGMLNDWIGFQKQQANSWNPQRDYYSWNSNQLDQAYRLYTLALANQPQLGAMNRLRNLDNLTIQARYRLAAAYHLVGKTEIAKKLISHQNMDVADYNELSGSYGSADRDKAMMLETLVLLGMKEEAKVILDELSSVLSSQRWLSTQTTAWSLLAVSKLLNQDDSDSQSMKFTYEVNQESKEDIETEAYIYQLQLEEPRKENQLKLTNTGGKTLFVRVQREGIPLAGDTTDAENALKMKVEYVDLSGKKIDPTKIKQGTDFSALVTITHPGLRDRYEEMALTQIFPSGWEIRNTRMDAGAQQAANFTYQDIRDDRVMTYFDINRGGSKTFEIKLNATYKGKFYLPTIYCEAMYDHQINARKAGKWVVVE